MTVRDLLASAGIAAVDAEVLLAHALRKNRTWLMAHADETPATADARAFEDFVRRRNAGEPVAYIVGEKEFYGRTFAVKPGVLIPRPCTESLVSAALDLLAGKNVEPVTDIDTGIVRAVHAKNGCSDVRTIVDVGTGSGCIAVTLAAELPGVRCVAIDVSEDALEVARANAEKHGVRDRVEFLHGNALEPLGETDGPFLVVTNPPYVTDAALLASDVFMHEPREALMGGGADGGDTLRAIVSQAKQRRSWKGIVAECLAAQARIVTGD